jgi:hypothetical protein
LLLLLLLYYYYFYCWCFGCFYCLTNLSLGVTTKNVTPQISRTHPTLKQHKTHIKKVFHFKYLSKGYPSHVQFKTRIKFTKNVFWCGKWMHKEKVSRMSHEGFFLSRTLKESIFWEIFLDVIFWEYFKCQPTWYLL